MNEESELMVMTNEKCEYEKKLCTWSDIEDEWIHNDDVVEVIDGDFVSQSYRDENYEYCQDTQDYRELDETWYDELIQVYYSLDTTSVQAYGCNTIASTESFEEDCDYAYIYRGEAEGYWLHCDETIWCEDIDEEVHENDATFCSVDDNYYYNQDEMPCDIDDDCIKSYHSNNHPTDLNPDYVHSYFSIGFEVEKTEFMDGACDEGDLVGTYDIFEGYETDSSCGVEAVTKILPLGSPRSNSRKAVFKMMDEASEIINCPSNTNCGGHMTVSCKDMKSHGDGYDMANRMRNAMSLIYALYRYRLKKSYCANNKGIKKEDNTKYSPVNIKGRLVELRLPSQIKSVKQLKLRYDLMYKVMYYSLVKPVSYDVFMQKVRHIVLKMYNGDNDKLNMIYSISSDFRKYLVNDEVSPTIESYINND